MLFRQSVAAAALLAFGTVANAAEELNALIWCDHSDPGLLKPFEDKFDVKVNVKEYEGTGTALALIEQSRPGDWDVFVVDGVDVPRVVEAGILAELPEDEMPIDDMFPEVRMLDVNKQNGKLYAVTEKFGYNTIAFNKTKVDPADMLDLNKVWSDKYKGRVATYDYYIPLMDIVALKMGMKPSDINADNLEQIKQELFKLKEASAMVGEVVAASTALATGDVDILVGGGEWAVAVLNAEQPELDWVIPEQGGVFWAQSIGVFEQSQKKELATEFVKYIVSPEGQARLATSACYWAMPSNEKAGTLLDDEQKKWLRWDQQKEYLAKSHRYFIPDADLDSEMLDVWAEFLQH